MKKVTIDKNFSISAKWNDDKGQSKYIDITEVGEEFGVCMDSYDFDLTSDEVEVLYQLLGAIISEKGQQK